MDKRRLGKTEHISSIIAFGSTAIYVKCHKAQLMLPKGSGFWTYVSKKKLCFRLNCIDPSYQMSNFDSAI